MILPAGRAAAQQFERIPQPERSPVFDSLEPDYWFDRYQHDAENDGPDIREPGPDLGDFPNSAATLPRGRAYLEFAPLTYAAADNSTGDVYISPFLIRYGLTNEVELRFFGNGLTVEGGAASATGVSPLCIDLKVHLWNENREWLVPAASLEVFIQTEWASKAFRSGTQPSINLNFDLPLTEDLTFEWTVGYSGVQQETPPPQSLTVNSNQFALQWAFEREMTERLQLFVHGYFNGQVLTQGEGDVVGLGFFWNQNKRLTFFGSCNVGIDLDVPPLSTQLGFAYAL